MKILTRNKIASTYFLPSESCFGEAIAKFHDVVAFWEGKFEK